MYIHMCIVCVCAYLLKVESCLAGFFFFGDTMFYTNSKDMLFPPKLPLTHHPTCLQMHPIRMHG